MPRTVLVSMHFRAGTSASKREANENRAIITLTKCKQNVKDNYIFGSFSDRPMLFATDPPTMATTGEDGDDFELVDNYESDRRSEEEKRRKQHTTTRKENEWKKN